MRLVVVVISDGQAEEDLLPVNRQDDHREEDIQSIEKR